jgi:hypothetical protein
MAFFIVATVKTSDLTWFRFIYVDNGGSGSEDSARIEQAQKAPLLLS